MTNPAIEVLIIEDDVKIAEINRRFVEQIEGFRVVGIATDEPQAAAQLEVLNPQLVLLDIYFPGSNGLSMLHHIRAQHRETDVIMITAARESEAVREAIRGGAFDYIMKPLVFNRLKETLVRYSAFRTDLDRLSRTASLSQSDVDRLTVGTPRFESGEMHVLTPKGIDRLTLDKVVQALASDSIGMTAEQVAKLIGASRSTSRRYLEHLVGQGDAYADLSYGVVGRPERVYRTKKRS
ncbi:DUF977 family protein [Paenibacillus methanolicus]|uniref:Transcriptional regulatory protein n=1 Tax=Paenibacillus methanolicus TaxID=582686 RepID=A0A5S5CIX2_9BACL|nr:DUF977 family protein [Paenibacillus methanolicus]TYP79474.1 response regulator of citrate/malate metabolism [Paenibacillus methanolicus]